MPYSFSPPTYKQKIGAGSLWGKVSIYTGRSVLKFGTSYRLVTDPSAEDLTAADAVYLGGRRYTISDDEAAALTAAGYSANLTFIGIGLTGPIYPSPTLFPSAVVHPRTA